MYEKRAAGEVHDMSLGAWLMVGVIVITIGTLLFVIASMLRSIRAEKSPGRSLWREFGLSLALMIIFFVTWVAQLIAQWQTFTDEQLEHDEQPQVGDFVTEFAQSTLENWQSEFLQLFTFVTLAALYIHKGSSESKDGEEKIEASLRRIEQQLGTLPDSAPSEPGEDWKLPETPLESADAAHSRHLTKQELYKVAQRLDVEGRSTMTKDELERAIADQPRD
jgi:hypothetical protein